MKNKHLEFIQNTISRMAANCFLIKGWCVTLVSALCAVSISQHSSQVYLLGYIPIVCFSFLDSYYLWLERRYRQLYEEVATLQDQTDFTMDTARHKGIKGGYWGAFWSVTVAPYYIGLAITILIVGIGLG